MSGTKGMLLIVEDDVAIAEGLALNLRLEGFATRVVATGEAALSAVREAPPNLVLLDITLPAMSGLDVVRSLRADGDQTPVIMLSARQDEYDKVAALRIGADDYVTKPFGVAELLARIDSVLRRSARGDRPGAPARGGATALGFSGVAIDVEQRVVSRQGRRVPLTHLEFELLLHLVQHPRRVFARHALLDAVWGVNHAGAARTVDNFLGQLRRKLEDDPDRPRHFVTVRGSGYRFDP